MEWQQIVFFDESCCVWKLGMHESWSIGDADNAYKKRVFNSDNCYGLEGYYIRRTVYTGQRLFTCCKDGLSFTYPRAILVLSWSAHSLDFKLIEQSSSNESTQHG
ncbi:hypothetical protein KPH14_005218 [Odynerus spinipes]|uniref:Uncharacterized protein n=1 Tax=Odynerus spinipes TaxID=1348599 RepID=A0AAD9VKY2_9HYME|nr:hypothetical protein KPH14_005218 [Odynerus spinipes]